MGTRTRPPRAVRGLRWLAAAAAVAAAAPAPAQAGPWEYELVTPADDAPYHARFLKADPDLSRIYYRAGGTAGRPAIELPDGLNEDYFSATRTAQGWQQAWLTPYCPGKFSVHDAGDCGGSLESNDWFWDASDGKITFSTNTGIPAGKPVVDGGLFYVVSPGTPEVYAGDAQTTRLLGWDTPPAPDGWGAGLSKDTWVVASDDQSTVAFTSADVRVPEAAGLAAGQHLYVRRGGALKLATAPVGGADGSCVGSCTVQTLHRGPSETPSTPYTPHDAIVTNVMSEDGQRVFFRTNRRLHPDATPGRTEVYVLDGHELRLLSDGLTDPAGVGSNSSFEWAAANGSRAFVVTGAYPLNPNFSKPAGRIWAVDVSSEVATPITPDGVTADFVWASADGSTAVVRSGNTFADAPAVPGEKLYVWREGAGTSYLGPTDADDTFGAVQPARRDIHGTADGSTIVFSTRAGLDPQDTNGVADLYRLRGDTVTWLTPRSGAAASGDISISLGLAAPGPAAAVSVPRPRALTADTETVFFSTTASLVDEDTDGGRRDVYSVRDGQYTLITPADDVQFDAVLLDNSADGSIVLFATQASVTEADGDGEMIDVYSARTSGAFADKVESSTGAMPPASGPGGAAPVPSAPSAGSSGSASSEDPVPVVPEWPADPGQQSGSSSAGELGLEDGPVFGARRALVPLVVPGRGRARVVLKGRVGKRTRTLARGSRSFARGGERSVRLRLTRHGRRFDGRRVTVRVVFVGADGERQRLRERTGLGDA